ncbi:hypothetical protein GE21DRAFT_9789 [Neurospora crassa]|uniref:Uncharacterized protein n=1 Tax=Neurospora crassa (strain ATCC 24698 / 74-OR23-1A / CBS 708.71 / DSM 1257 / FGSC 987) TaxID=367110 RepID=Q7S3G6_NEUCR|nr:hypothetical protein NCU06887 [Neurospora crassa OR74A]EAA29998.1 hypothetical protein NCU06887 [Neurospora crassa OR74A]KHE82560.1 hypothetical protein GE21DRAFT_9789 [Neurospora crassa]|eukprot:XP_959234.1 hypothetical protein NCU06887 [Neurospora crassa OR74A]
MEQWELPDLRPSVGYQLQLQGGNYLSGHSGLAPTPNPTPANSARSGNGISTPTRTTAVTLKPWSYYTLDSVKKKYRNTERILNNLLEISERQKNRYASDIDELKQSHRYLASLKELKRTVDEANDKVDRLAEERQNWMSLVESLQFKSVEDEVKMASEDSKTSVEKESKHEFEHESENGSDDDSPNDSDYEFNDDSEEESEGDAEEEFEGDSEEELGKGIGEDHEMKSELRGTEAVENSEQDSEENKDMESICSDDLWDDWADGLLARW